MRIQRTFDIKPAPFEVALILWEEYDCFEQAELLREIGRLLDTRPGRVMQQLDHVRDVIQTSPDNYRDTIRGLMQVLNDYLADIK